jgi:hypothetical protein
MIAPLGNVIRGGLRGERAGKLSCNSGGGAVPSIPTAACDRHRAAEHGAS